MGRDRLPSFQTGSSANPALRYSIQRFDPSGCLETAEERREAMMTVKVPPLESIKAPDYLRDLPIWLCWQLETNKKASKPLKVPYYVNGARRSYVHGSPADRALLVDFDSAKKAAIAQKRSGVGLALLEGYDVTALDFDNCVVNGEIDPVVTKLVADCYSEYSPSGNGIRAFISGNFGDKKSPTTAEQFGFEVFNHKGFVTFTGNATPLLGILPRTLPDPSTPLLSFINQRFKYYEDQYQSDNIPSKLGLSVSSLSGITKFLDPGCSYDEWLKIGMALFHETSGSEEGFILWDSWSANHSKYSTEEYNRSKWDSFGHNVPAKHITARSLIKMAQKCGYEGRHSELLDTDFEVLSVVSSHPSFDSGARKGIEHAEMAEKFDQYINNPFHIRSAAAFMELKKSISWLIKGFLPRATLGVLYGESGSGKSFVALDLCAALRRGTDWNGLRCPRVPCRILYVAAEGVHGFSNRLTAYLHEVPYGEAVRETAFAEGLDVISDVAPNLLNPESVKHLMLSIETMGGYDLIVMDTFAQVTPGGNENSGEDMGLALGHCKRLSQTSGAMVLLIHHSGKDLSKGARGWSGIHAAADVVYEVTHLGDDRFIEEIKQKDSISGRKFGFKLKPVVLGKDEDGDEVSSCVVDWTGVFEHQITEVKEIGLPPQQKLIDDCFKLLEGLNDGMVETEELIAKVVEIKLNGSLDVKGNTRTNVKKSLKKLVDGGHFAVDGIYILYPSSFLEG